MSSGRWGPVGPPEDAYGRVTNPERFPPLHGIAHRLVDELCRRFTVDHTTADELDEELVRSASAQGIVLAHPTIRLTPQHPDQAAIVLAFTGFPGLRVRFGRWYKCSFPDCGCDACDETAEGETERLRWHVTKVVEGRYREAVFLDRDGTSWIQREFGSDTDWSCTRQPVTPELARRFLAENGTDRRFRPWSPR